MNNELSKGIGARIKVFRQEHNMTQQDFADMFGMSKVWVHSVEKGRHMLPIECMRVLKGRFGMSYDYIIDGETPPANESDYLKDRVKELSQMNSLLHEHVSLLKASAPGNH